MTATTTKVSLETVIDNLLSAIIVMDRTTSILMANKMAELFAQKSKEQFFGLRGGEAFNCIHANDVPEGCGYGPSCKFCTVRQTVENTFEDKCNKQCTEAELIFESMGRRDLKLTTTYLPNDDLVILAMEDVTESKQMENERLEKGKLIAAIETAGAVCHEMNQPLQIISGYIDIFALKTGNNQPCDSSHVETIQAQVKRLAEITRKLQNIRRFSKKNYIGDSDILDIDKSTEVA